MAVRLDREQQRVLSTILDVARRRRVTPTELFAAVATGLVEANLRNPNYGDRDSVGWRQERSHYGPASTRLDVRAAANRFFDETRQNLRQYPNPYKLAQSVQRSAYPGRYAEQADMVRALIRQYGGVKTKGAQDLLGGRWLSGGAPTAGRGGALVGQTVTGRGQVSVQVPPLEMGGSGQAGVLAAELAAGRRPVVQVSAPPPFAFSATRALAMPAGAAEVPQLGAPAPKQQDLESLLSAATDLRGAGLPVTVRGSATARMAVPGSAPASPGRGGGAPRPRGGPVNQVVQVGEFLKSKGFTPREHPRWDPVDGDHVRGSYHFKRRAIDFPTGASGALRLIALLQRHYPNAKWIWNGPQPKNKAGKINYLHGHTGHVHVQI